MGTLRAKSGNMGITLLELIIGMAISGIVVLMIITFISGAVRVFQKANNEVNLQMEAQTAMNQMINLMMEGKAVTHETTPDSERYLIEVPNIDGYAVIFKQNKLYLVQLSAPDTLITVDPTIENNLLAQYVDDFTMTPVVADNSVWQLELKLKISDSRDTYELTRKVKLRNFATPTPSPTPTSGP